MEGIDGKVRRAPVRCRQTVFAHGLEFGLQAGIAEDAAGFVRPPLLDQQTTLQKAKRTLHNAHRLIGDEAMNTGILHQALRQRQRDDVIGADKLDHQAPFREKLFMFCPCRPMTSF